MKPLLARIDRWQQRHPSVALPLAVLKRFGEHGGSRLAATISYFSFFSVFPLLLVLVTVLNIVLQDESQERRDELLDGVLGQIPVIGTQLSGPDAALGGSVVTLVIGLATAVWAGLGAVSALQTALDEMSDVPMHDRPNFAVKKLRSVAFLVAFALALVLSTFLASLAALFDVGAVVAAASFLATALVNTGILVLMFTLLPARRRPLRAVLPGAVAGGIALTLLLLLGQWVVDRFIKGASDTYGTFAIVIALLSWFALVSRLVLLADETNEVVANRLWPRSLAPGGELTAADRQAALLDMRRVRRDARFDFALAVGDDIVGTQEPADPDRPQRSA